MRMRKKPNLIPRLERCAHVLENSPEALRGSWLDDYRRRQALTGRHVTLIPNGSEPRGATVLGIDDDCRLLVRCDGDLAPTAFGSDEIRVIPELGALA